MLFWVFFRKLVHRVGMAATTAIRTSRVPWIRKTYGEFLMTAEISFKECTCVNMSCCDWLIV